MPTIRLKACPKCNKTMSGDKKYCTKCQAEKNKERREYFKKQDNKRPNSNERGYNYKWRIAREKFLRLYPICNICGQKKATLVDHIMPHKGNQELFWDKSNWQPSCKECHDRKTARGE